MAKDAGEGLFEQYLATNGFEIREYEPDLGTPKRPDYLVRAAGREVVVEVESFNLPAAVPTQDGFFNMTPLLSRVRDKIKKGADQLRGIEGYPLVVVLTNPNNALLPLDGPLFVSAMYGDLEVSFPEGEDLQMRFGRNGRLHVDEPDGSVRGHHSFLSAVGVLRKTFTEDAHAAAMLQSRALGHENPLAVVREAQRIVAELGESAVETVCLDVYETVSDSAVPLPRGLFAGPYDTLWGKIAPGHYGPISPTPRAVHFFAEPSVPEHQANGPDPS